MDATRGQREAVWVLIGWAQFDLALLMLESGHVWTHVAVGSSPPFATGRSASETSQMRKDEIVVGASQSLDAERP